jgi:hypothetical protein
VEVFGPEAHGSVAGGKHLQRTTAVNIGGQFEKERKNEGRSRRSVGSP